MGDIVYIYRLVDPDTEEIRYVGKTINVDERLRKHRRDALREGGTKYYRNAWLKSLYQNGKEPKVEIIKETNLDNWQYWEQHFIAEYKNKGFPLTNMSDGGEGVVMRGEEHPNHGKTLSTTTREKISKKAKQRWDSGKYDEIRHVPLSEKWGDEAANRHRQRMIRYNKRKVVSEETKQKISKYQSRPILLLNESGDIVYEFQNAQKAADFLGCGKSNVNNCRRFGQRLLRKYRVVYKDEYEIL